MFLKSKKKINKGKRGNKKPKSIKKIKGGNLHSTRVTTAHVMPAKSTSSDIEQEGKP